VPLTETVLPVFDGCDDGGVLADLSETGRAKGPLVFLFRKRQCDPGPEASGSREAKRLETGCQLQIADALPEAAVQFCRSALRKPALRSLLSGTCLRPRARLQMTHHVAQVFVGGMIQRGLLRLPTALETSLPSPPGIAGPPTTPPPPPSVGGNLGQLFTLAGIQTLSLFADPRQNTSLVAFCAPHHHRRGCGSSNLQQPRSRHSTPV
jgi:hypothetical protein